MKRRIILSIISLMLFVCMVLGVSYAFFENGIINNGEFKQNIVFESETYRLTTQGNMALTSEVTPLAMFGTDIDKVVSETSTTINLTLENYDEEYRVCTYDVVWNWNETSDEYMISEGATKEYTISGGTITEQTIDKVLWAFENNEFSEVQLPSADDNNNILFSGIIEGDSLLQKEYTFVQKFYNLAEIDQKNHIGKSYSGYVTIENIVCNKTQYPKLSTYRGKNLFALVSEQGIDTSEVTEIYFADLNSSWPGSEADVAYFTAQDGGIIKSWVNGNKLYVGQQGKVMPGPSMEEAFADLYNLTLIDLSGIDTIGVTTMYRMFNSTGNDSSDFVLELGENFNTSNVTTMYAMFYETGYGSTKVSFDLGDKFDTSRVNNMAMMFCKAGYNSQNLTINLGDKFDTSNVTNMYGMFNSLGRAANAYDLDLGDKFDTSKVTNMHSMFASINKVRSLDLGDKFDTSNVTDMYQMFAEVAQYIASFDMLDLGDKFNTSKVTTMYGMFHNFAKNSIKLKLCLGNKFDTSNVTTMRQMFQNVGVVSRTFTLDLGEKFDISNATDIAGLFNKTGRAALDFTLDLGSKFDTSNANDMQYMFRECGYSNPNFQLDLGSKFDTSKVTNMQYMFTGTGYSNPNFELNLSDFNILSSCNLTAFVQNTASKIILGEGWSNATLVSGMFKCDSSKTLEIVNAPANILAYDFAADNRVSIFTTI